MRDSYNKNKKPFRSPKRGGDTNGSSNNTGDPRYAHIQPVQIRPLEVIVYNDNFDRAAKAFRSLVQKERILSEYKDRQSYEKPSDKKRRRRNEARRKAFEFENDRSEYKPINKSSKNKRENHE